MRPQDAVMHRRLLEAFADVAGAWIASDEPFGGESEQYVTWLDILRSAARPGLTYLVNTDMTAVAKAAGAVMPTETLLADDLPSRAGFMLYDSPIDESGIVGVCWLRQDTFSAWGGPESETRDAVNIYPLRWGDDHWRRKTGCSLMPSAAQRPSADMRHASYLWAIGDAPMYDDAGVSGVLRATWRLMQQTITVSKRQEADSRADRRAMRKLGLPPEEITVVELRRREIDHDSDDEAGAASVDWTHRWLVDGHWRNQWLPSRSTHRLQWISGYVKGPADKPLVVKERVKHWVR